ncbi:hypothetical protein DL765_008133 [Monosporascus sp. GIB2]|nr:hypothetical protein DL765_008133 [Monosporascus sp. GIB2]
MRSSVALAALNAALALSTPSREARGDCRATSAWPGWENVKHAFIFGDSYTQTGFDYRSTNPSPSNPLGNPPYPGWTSSNGPNWVGFLTTKHNASLLRTYNLAYGGATVDSDLVAPYDPSVVSMKEQVRSRFLPGYAGGSPSAPGAPRWTGGDSVFAFWIGINDVGNSWWLAPAERDRLYARIFALYADLAAQLRRAGARNFVFVNVPPVDRSPMMIGQGPENAAAERAVIAGWNARVAGLAAALKKAPGPGEVNAWVYDANASFEAALDDPAAFEATAGLRNLTEYCDAYQK